MKKMTSAKALLLILFGWCADWQRTSLGRSQIVTNCAQVSAVTEVDKGFLLTVKDDATLLADFAGGTLQDDEACAELKVLPPVPMSVGDYIWEDTDQNGKQDAGETALEGVTVTLLDKDGNPAKDLEGKDVALSTTLADGKYLFSNLPEGDYQVVITPPKDYIPTTNAGGVNDFPANDDSNCAAQGDGVTSTCST